VVSAVAGRGAAVKLRPVKIAGLSTYVPPRLLTNADLERMVETSDEWIRQRTGIQERRWAADGEGATDLARVASLEALKRAGKNPTREGLVHAFESMQLNLGGFNVGYSPTTRTGSEFVDLTMISKGGKFIR